MSFSFEMYFDARSERAIRGVWDRLCKDGLLSEDLQGESRPHVSLSVCTSVIPETTGERLASFCREYSAFGLWFGSVGHFLSAENVIYAAPGVSRELLEFHRRFHEAFESMQIDIWEYYLPGRWQPHCTLAIDVPEAAFYDSFRIIRESFTAIAVRVESIALVEFKPVSILRECRLSG